MVVMTKQIKVSITMPEIIVYTKKRNSLFSGSEKVLRKFKVAKKTK